MQNGVPNARSRLHGIGRPLRPGGPAARCARTRCESLHLGSLVANPVGADDLRLATRSPGYGGEVNSSIESLIVRIGLPAGQRRGRGAVAAGWAIAASLPLIGLVSLLWRSE